MNAKFRHVFTKAKKSFKRELGFHAFMIVFSLAALVVAIPIIFIAEQLPDWAWIVLIIAAIIWFFVGDTIKAAISAYRNY
jgi:hypothetical protein